MTDASVVLSHDIGGHFDVSNRKKKMSQKIMDRYIDIDALNNDTN